MHIGGNLASVLSLNTSVVDPSEVMNYRSVSGGPVIYGSGRIRSGSGFYLDIVLANERNICCQIGTGMVVNWYVNIIKY